MKVIQPTPIATAMLVAPNSAETDASEWAPGVTYTQGQQVIRTPTHRIWQSAAGGNKANDPATAGQTAWIDMGPTNRWAMFDQAVGTLTEGTGTIDVTLAPGRAGAIAILDTNAETVRVRMTVGGSTIYDETIASNISGGIIADWHAYFTAPIGKLQTLLFLDLPLYANGQIEVTITGPDPQGPVTVGTLLVGGVTDLGSTEASPTVGIIDYSKKTTDDFGVTTVVERAWSKQMQAKAMMETSAVDGLQRSLAAVRAVPCLWVGEEGYDALTVYGFFKDFSIDLTVGMDPDTRTGGTSYVTLTIEGLI